MCMLRLLGAERRGVSHEVRRMPAGHTLDDKGDTPKQTGCRLKDVVYTR
jgi:hypothetical protein